MRRSKHVESKKNYIYIIDNIGMFDSMIEMDKLFQ